jgi:hypothetical protein
VVVPELEALMGSHTTRKYWTAEDEAIVRKYYGKVPTEKLAKQIGRTIEAVQNKANKLKKVAS